MVYGEKRTARAMVKVKRLRLRRLDRRENRSASRSPSRRLECSRVRVSVLGVGARTTPSFPTASPCAPGPWLLDASNRPWGTRTAASLQLVKVHWSEAWGLQTAHWGESRSARWDFPGSPFRAISRPQRRKPRRAPRARYMLLASTLRLSARRPPSLPIRLSRGLHAHPRTRLIYPTGFKMLPHQQNGHKSKVLVFGAGNFGSCLADHLGDSSHTVYMWSRSENLVKHFNQFHRNPEALQDHLFAESITAVGPEFPSAKLVQNMDVLLFAIPTEGVR